jgi:hypothetical protein
LSVGRTISRPAPLFYFYPKVFLQWSITKGVGMKRKVKKGAAQQRFHVGKKWLVMMTKP